MRKLQKDYTTPEQSKRLLELGVPADSANRAYKIDITGKIFYVDIPEDTTYTRFAASIIRAIGYNYFPAWTVGRLMEIIDICEIDPKDEEYHTTKMIKDETKMNYIDYLVGTVRMMLPRLDFSKLEEEK